jgi:2-amino-4-hydroxy-6-hydroxymethyldihydropteridine diphosphokinase
MTKAVLALGSNLGDREATIVEAILRIADVAGVELLVASALHESAALKPHGVDPAAPAYLNAVVIVDTDLTPEQLLESANAIEKDLGRVRGERWADRTLDIDLIEFSGQTRETEALTLPHPRAAERSFVLAPWLEIDPEAEFSGERVRDLLARLEGS